MNKDCNLTAGLEEIIHLGSWGSCHVADTGAGLVNGAIRTIFAIHSTSRVTY